MKHSSNSYKHTPTIAKQPCDFRNHTSHSHRSRIPVDNHSDQPVLPVCDRSPSLFVDFMRLIICSLAGAMLIALLVPVAFAADERESATPVVEYIPVVSTATEPVLTTAVAEAYAQEASVPAMAYCTATVDDSDTPDNLSDVMVQMCEVMIVLATRMQTYVQTYAALLAIVMLGNIAYSYISTRGLKKQIKELSDKIDAMSRPQNKP